MLEHDVDIVSKISLIFSVKNQLSDRLSFVLMIAHLSDLEVDRNLMPACAIRP